MSNKTKEKMVVFSIGATAYTVIELLWRQHTHWSMSLAGGTCFSILYHIYNRWRVMPLARKCLIGSAVITGVEFIFRCSRESLAKMECLGLFQPEI